MTNIRNIAKQIERIAGKTKTERLADNMDKFIGSLRTEYEGSDHTVGISHGAQFSKVYQQTPQGKKQTLLEIDNTTGASRKFQTFDSVIGLDIAALWEPYRRF